MSTPIHSETIFVGGTFKHSARKYGTATPLRGLRAGLSSERVKLGLGGPIFADCPEVGVSIALLATQTSIEIELAYGGPMNAVSSQSARKMVGVYEGSVTLQVAPLTLRFRKDRQNTAHGKFDNFVLIDRSLIGS